MSQAVDIEDDGKIRCVIYGRPGTGKTTLAGTFPKPALLIDVPSGRENGAKSLLNVKGIKKIVIRDTQDLATLTSELKEDNVYKSVIVDHLTNLQDLILKEVLDLPEIPVQKTWGMATQNQYGQVGIQMKQLLRNILDLDKEIALLAHEKVVEIDDQESTINPYVSALLSPTIMYWVTGSCDYLVQTYIRSKMDKVKVKIGGKTTIKEKVGKGVEYCLRVSPGPVFTVKFRKPKGEVETDSIVDPDYNKLRKAIYG